MVFSGTSTTITRWNDKSGNGLHGTATGTPTYTANALNGLGAPALNSNANYFITPTFIISPTAGTPSIFMVMNQTSYSGTGNSDFFLASDWQRIDFLGQGGAFNAAATMNGGAQTPINATTTSNNPTLLSFVVNTASGGVGYANGTFTATSGSSGGSSTVYRYILYRWRTWIYRVYLRAYSFQQHCIYPPTSTSGRIPGGQVGIEGKFTRHPSVLCHRQRSVQPPLLPDRYSWVYSVDGCGRSEQYHFIIGIIDQHLSLERQERSGE